MTIKSSAANIATVFLRIFYSAASVQLLWTTKEVARRAFRCNGRLARMSSAFRYRFASVRRPPGPSSSWTLKPTPWEAVVPEGRPLRHRIVGRGGEAERRHNGELSLRERTIHDVCHRAVFQIGNASSYA